MPNIGGIMLELKNVTITRNERVLVKDLSFTVNEGDKLAIIGEEGVGKTTLLKAIMGEKEDITTTGVINYKGKLGYLSQTLKKENRMVTGYHFLFQKEEEYYEKISNFYEIIETLNLNSNILEQKISTLSGGEKIKLGILKILLEECDVYLFDEPTNDLDIETLLWLENFINQTSKPIIFVSHDETLLSTTANMIVHLEQWKKRTECRNKVLKIDYDTYVEQRLQKIKKQTQQATREKRDFLKKQKKLMQIMQKVEYQQNTISRKNPHGAKVLKKKMHTLKYQEKKLNTEKLTELPDMEEGIYFFFEIKPIPNSKRILQITIPKLTVEEKELSKNIQLEIFGGKHIGIIGKNGVGKTTLMKQIYDTLKDRTDIRVGYMPQNYEEILKDYEYVLDFLSSTHSKDISKIRAYLGNMKFTKEEMQGKIQDLSNGTKAKLFLLKFILDECNVLLLDEPTRNLSPLSNPVIRNVLKNYPGAIISISHDRKFLFEVIDEIYHLDENGLLKQTWEEEN